VASHAVLQTFYASRKWIAFRKAILAERGLMCQHCGKLIAREREAHLHHTIELTPANVYDATIALNPDNVLVVHKTCHDSIHDRLRESREATRLKGVYIVYGMPGSGKTTFVTERKGRHDIVVDMDRLYQAITLLPDYDKPDCLFSVVREVYNLLIDTIRYRRGKWQSAWVIGGFPDKHQRERLAEELGAELIYIECTRDEAVERIRLDERRRLMVREYEGYIDRWLERYVE
jgi:hypothetical protein